ncbi:MAG TPA: glycosyltransferase [Chloroflexi bacterium]|nr:glycosyltransferase [Chloroflexota bacterium]
MKYSIIAPVYNEEETLTEFYNRVLSVMDSLDGLSELLLIDDGSTDASLDLMRGFQQQTSLVRVISFSRNFGHQVAITAGIDYAIGDAVIVIDADLQDPPEVIPELVAQWQEGFELVLAVRSMRKGESWFKRTTASFFYRLINKLTDLHIPKDSGDFRLMDRKVVEALREVREQHRFMRGLSVWVGFRHTQVEYVRNERFAGISKYPLKRMLNFATDGITSFSHVPLQLAMSMGFIFAGIALLGIPAIITLRFSGSREFFGQATTLVSVLLLGGVQLICLGIVGEYLGRIYNEVRRRPLYLISGQWGFDSDDQKN